MDLPHWLDTVATIMVSIIGSSGIWTFLQNFRNKKDAKQDLIVGLAHERIISVGMEYINRGWITKDEYEDFLKYLYIPYSQTGSNGLAKKIADEVSKLPFKDKGYQDDRSE